VTPPATPEATSGSAGPGSELGKPSGSGTTAHTGETPKTPHVDVPVKTPKTGLPGLEPLPKSPTRPPVVIPHVEVPVSPTVARRVLEVLKEIGRTLVSPKVLVPLQVLLEVINAVGPSERVCRARR
jgi:hypothetical protein